jgi:lysyl-tRNA synthetase class 2
MKAARPQRTKCIETPESSSIARFCYDGPNQVLVIQFKHGGIYNYSDVPATVFREMIAAPSKGQFFLENIRDKYDYTRV